MDRARSDAGAARRVRDRDAPASPDADVDVTPAVSGRRRPDEPHPVHDRGADVAGRAVQMTADLASIAATPACWATTSAPRPTSAPPMNPIRRPPRPASAERSASSSTATPTSAITPPTLPGMPSNGLGATIRTHPIDGRHAGLSEVTTTWYRPWTAPRPLGLTVPSASLWSVNPDWAGTVIGQNSACTTTFPSGPGPDAVRLASSSMPTTMAWSWVAAASSGTPLIANVQAPAAATIPGRNAVTAAAASRAAAKTRRDPLTAADHVANREPRTITRAPATGGRHRQRRARAPPFLHHRGPPVRRARARDGRRSA